MTIPIIDAHLDLAWNACHWNRDLSMSLAQIARREKGMTDHRGRGHATITLEEMHRGQIVLCLGTLLTRCKPQVQPLEGHARRSIDYATQTLACAAAYGQLAYYRLLQDSGAITIIKSAADLDRHWKKTAGGLTPTDPLGLIIAMEGADPIITPAQAEKWFTEGLRFVGLAHYGKSAYAVGTGDAGPLTPAGIELLKEFERLGMIVDLTHSSDPSFFQALEVFSGPVIASHNNCRAIIPGDRQYSDEQIKLLIQRKAVIGASFDGWMLYPNYKHGQTPKDAITYNDIVNHIDHICQIAGNTNHVAIGSDLDGGFGYEQTPKELNSIADLQLLAPVLKSRGYTDADIIQIFHGNWLRFFREHLPK